MARDRLLSQFASGIATIPINTDYTNRVLTIGSTITLSPNGQISASGVSTFSNNVHIGTGITFYASSGIVTAGGGFVGNLTGTASTASFATTAFTLDGVAAGDLEVAYSINSGISTNVVGGYVDASNASISGITTLGFFSDEQLVSRSITLANNTTYYSIHKNITVGSGSTLIVGSGSSIILDRFNNLDNPSAKSVSSPFIMSYNIINEIFTIPANYNAISIGPIISISDGSTVTVGSGAYWSISV